MKMLMQFLICTALVGFYTTSTAQDFKEGDIFIKMNGHEVPLIKDPGPEIEKLNAEFFKSEENPEAEAEDESLLSDDESNRPTRVEIIKRCVESQLAGKVPPHKMIRPVLEAIEEDMDEYLKTRYKHLDL